MPSSIVESVCSVTAPPLIHDRIGVLSDDECMRRLADAVVTDDSSIWMNSRSYLAGSQ
jgi:hypothetical protein